MGAKLANTATRSTPSSEKMPTHIKVDKGLFKHYLKRKVSVRLKFSLRKVLVQTTQDGNNITKIYNTIIESQIEFIIQSCH